MLPNVPTSDPRKKPHFRPRFFIINAAGSEPTDVPTSIIVIGAVTKVKFPFNIEIATSDAVMKVNVLPLLNKA